MSIPSKILIVDDEPAIVEYLQLEMEKLGCTTVTAANGQEALDKVAAESPDLILMDVRMPGMDGLAACRILKGGQETRLIPIVILTALDGMEDRIKGIEGGADDYLAKPINRRELITRVQTTLKLKHAVDQQLGELRLARDHFGKFVPETIRRLASVDPELRAAKRERDLSVLFVDISGYTGLSERLSPRTLTALVECYFSSFLDRIQEGGGDITEMGGDGFMAIFQDADVRAHALKATAAALALLQVTDALNRETNGRALSIHMGVNSGMALVGAARFEGRRGVRWTFTALGAVTNLAARLSAASAPGELLAGPETVRRLGDRYLVEPLGLQRLKNIGEPVEVHRILKRL
ncbi:MAG: response regulator [Candidatus Rokubacteria bacterium]|nr:response regulator [Candidatus Rokubacteria bacterium]